MSYTQTFLPVRTADNRVLGLLTIPSTTFAGNETSFVVNGTTYNISLVTPTRPNVDVANRPPNPSHMTITVTPQQERGQFQSNDILQSFIPTGQWRGSPGSSVKVESSNPLINILKGHTTGTIVAPVAAVPTAVNASFNVNWAASNAPYLAMAEVNWVQLLQVASGNNKAASINVDSVIVPGAALSTPTAPVGAGATTGGTLAAATYFTKIVAVAADGTTTNASPEASTTTTGATGSIGYTWTAVTNAVSYQVWYGTATGAQNKFYAVSGTSFTLTAATGTSGTIPATNKTGLSLNPTGKIGLFVVGAHPEIVNQSILLSTLRFVKLTSAAIAAGSYSWTAIVTNSDRTTVSVVLTLIIT